ncbi:MULTISPECIES: MarR family transcriptional regulator [Pannonibacter]|jgi:DNA-binding MarR family transcriptional regulator|uniref:MarR family transcriptional regulator n=1 Tax=Pannonibacter TaxID=227873 RepID=UPI000D0EB0D7|nr:MULTISPECIES: MarR family transcriptional regulator [Pannonibacter]MCY1707858.1 MarR family transcriptional regulator [Pannonibacter sp. SL95]
MAVEIRASQALKLWHDVNLSLVRDEEQDLSARQITILLTVYLEPPPHTVRGLAARLGVTKPAITRALDTLGGMRLLSRKRDEADKRNVIITRTVEGALYLDRLGDLVVEKAKSLPR